MRVWSIAEPPRISVVFAGRTLAGPGDGVRARPGVPLTRPTQPSDPTLRTATLPTGPFSYTDEGRGPVVVTVSGYPGGPRDFRWLAAALGSDVRVIRLAMPAFGQTPLGTEPRVDIISRARFVVRAVEALGLTDVLLVGHSMGGGLAGIAALELGARVRGLALLCSIGATPHPGVEARSLSILHGLIHLPVVGWAVRQTLPRLFERLGFPRRWSIPQLAHTIDCAVALDFAHWAKRIPQLPCPTLVAWGEDDPIIPVSIARALAANAPDGPRIAFPDGGHNIQKHHAVELATALRAMLGLRSRVALPPDRPVDP